MESKWAGCPAMTQPGYRQSDYVMWKLDYKYKLQARICLMRWGMNGSGVTIAHAPVVGRKGLQLCLFQSVSPKGARITRGCQLPLSASQLCKNACWHRPLPIGRFPLRG